jgi:hypothetical protein
LVFCFMRFLLRKLKKAFILPMACSTQTRTLANAALQRRWLRVSGVFLRALRGLKIKRGLPCFSSPLKPESTWTRKGERSDWVKISLKIAKSWTCPSYRLLINKIRRNWSQMSSHFRVCCFFYHYTGSVEHLD